MDIKYIQMFISTNKIFMIIKIFYGTKGNKYHHAGIPFCKISFNMFFSNASMLMFI